MKTEDRDMKKNESYIFYVLIIIFFMQQQPGIPSNMYSMFRLTIYLIMFILLTYLFINSRTKNLSRLFKATFILFLFSFLIFVAGVIGGKRDFTNVEEIAIPLAVLFSSLQRRLSKENLSNLLVLYFILSFFLSISVVLKYNLNFNISDQYLVASKNQIGPFLAYGAMLGVYDLSSKERKMHINKLLEIIITGVILMTIVMMRNRASIVAIIVVLLIIFIKKLCQNLSKKRLIQFMLLILILATLFQLGMFDPLFKVLNDALFLNYNISDINSLSANRTNIYKAAIDYVRSNPFFGELTSSYSFTNLYGHAHNYIINKFVMLGLIAGFPFFMYYCYLWVLSFKNFTLSKSNKLSGMMLLFALIVSLVEYTYPFGPGASQFLLWFLIGQETRKLSYLRL